MIVATGARYRKLDVPDLERFEGAGVYYAATMAEAQLCAGDPVLIVGGGNSAGQAAMFLSQHAASCRLMIRGPTSAVDVALPDRRDRARPQIELITRPRSWACSARTRWRRSSRDRRTASDARSR